MSTQLCATHNRAGEITYEQIDELTIRATIVTYTRTSSIAADRDSLTLFWGDGDSTVVQRSNGNGFELPNDIKRNEYVGEHTYPTRGTYTMSVTDPNRIAGILNIDFPNSVNIRFYIQTTFSLLEPRFQGSNSSAILLQPPIDFACVGEVYTYNPNAYDVDGDSLSYELITPFSEKGLEVPNYQLPDEIRSGPDNTIELDPITGDFTWNAPQVQGEYNITYRINEYRSGVLINSIVRDMQILVRACSDENVPPEIEVIQEFCVIAGEFIEIDILGTDADSIEILTLTASGGPFELEDNPAILEVGESLPNSRINGRITWQTTCDNVSNEFYQIVVRVTDDLSNDNTGLATLTTIRIKVTAPSPTGLTAENINGVVTLNWDNPYSCEEGSQFQGFSVWRKLGSESVSIDTCKGGLEGTPYERVVFLTSETDINGYVARDAEIDPGEIYCYRVVAEFALLTDLGNPYNRSQSLASEEICIRSSGEEPLITKVSVNQTNAVNGEIIIEWLNPDAADVDTTILIGPYQLEIEGGEGLTGASLSTLETFDYPSGAFNRISDTSFTNGNINTVDDGHSYKLTFRSGLGPDDFEASSDVVSSVFLNAEGSDRSIQLQWAENVPWNNYLYRIYQIDAGAKVLIDSTDQQSIRINGLENGREYCYVVESEGSYNVSTIKEPLINLSNEDCGTAMDDAPPCVPDFVVNSVCDSQLPSTSTEFINSIEWSFGSGICDLPSDLNGINIYYTPIESEPLSLLERLEKTVRSFEHVLNDNIAGCYAITTIDSSGNESDLSTVICVDNCPDYILPNAFTPNDDNANDVFVPRLNRFVESVDFKVFNRWGQKVFETSDPSLNWDGTNLNRKELAEGTYYYTCAVFEKRVSGITEGTTLKGTIQLMR